MSIAQACDREKRFDGVLWELELASLKLIDAATLRGVSARYTEPLAVAVEEARPSFSQLLEDLFRDMAALYCREGPEASGRAMLAFVEGWCEGLGLDSSRTAAIRRQVGLPVIGEPTDVPESADPGCAVLEQLAWGLQQVQADEKGVQTDGSAAR